MLGKREPLPGIDRLVLGKRRRFAAERGKQSCFVSAERFELAVRPRLGAARAEEGAHRDRPQLRLVVDAAIDDITVAEALAPVEEPVESGGRSARRMRSAHALRTPPAVFRHRRAVPPPISPAEWMIIAEQ